jgi:acyl dehydratase
MSGAERAKARGMFFEDFEVGMQLATPARTVTSTDIVNFACLTGDFNEVHCNYEYAKTTPFGEVIAHGPLVYGMAGGLQYASGINDGTLLALLGIDKWRLKTAVKHGDTIRMVQTVLSKRQSSKPDRGVVTLKREIVNQRGELVQEMETTLLYRCRNEG